LTPYKQ